MELECVGLEQKQLLEKPAYSIDSTPSKNLSSFLRVFLFEDGGCGAKNLVKILTETASLTLRLS